MITDKEDYRYVAQNAMKHVTVKGTPFPTRGGLLTFNGEDEAFLREAAEERYAVAYLSQPHAIYASAIWHVKRNLDALIYALYKNVTTHYVDPEQFSASKSLTLFTHQWKSDDGGAFPGDPDGYIHINTKDAELASTINSLQTSLNNAIAAVNTNRTNQKAAKDQAATSARQQREGQRDTALANQTTAHTSALNAIEQEHAQKLAEIAASTRHPNEKRHLVDVETDRYRKAVESENRTDALARRTIIETAKADLNQIAYQLELDKNAIDSSCDADIADMQEDFDTTVTGLRTANVNYCFEILCRVGGPNMTQMMNHCPIYNSYLDGITALYIAKTCAGEFYRKPYAFRNMTAGGLMRVFADLERMTICDLMGSVSLSRKSYQVTGDWGHRDYHENNGATGDWNLLHDTVVYPNETVDESCTSRAFSIFFGTRTNQDRIQRIYADVMIERTESWSKDKTAQIGEAMDELEDSVNELWESWDPEVTDRFDDVYYVTSAWSCTFTRDSYSPVPDYIQAADVLVAAYNARFDPDGDLRSEYGYFSQRYIERVTFDREGIQAAAWVNEWDALTDERDRRLKVAADTRDASLAASNDTYLLAVEAAQTAKDAAYATAEETYQDALAAAHTQAYAPAIAELNDLNTSISHEMDISVCVEMVDEFFATSVADAKEEYDRLAAIALQTRTSARTAADTEYNNAVTQANTEKSTRDSVIQQTYTTAANQISTWFSGQQTDFNNRYAQYCRENPDGERWRNTTRVRFTGTVPLVGTDHQKPDTWTRYLHVLRLERAFAVLSPRTATSVDFSEYYAEIDPDA